MAENEVEVANVEEEVKSMKVTMADLCAKGAAFYSRKNYEEAADLFSRASNLQAELLGETALENAEVLFLYGRCLFKVGQSKSDVLGGPAADEKKTKTKANGSASTSRLAAEVGANVAAPQKVASVTEKSKEADGRGQDLTEGKKLLFQFTGDENFDDSEDDEEQADDEEGGEEEEEEDDLATAFEILDLARVCFRKQLDQLQEDENGKNKGKEVKTEDSPAVRHIKERLAETHDCLAEISLENERYPNAIEDGRTSLNYKLDLYPESSDIVAEAHYKLSLALEFSSVTASDNDGKNTKREEMDQDLRNEAIKHMELAIKSFRLKTQAVEAEIADSESTGDNEVSQKALAEMKDIIADMEQRLVDLRNEPISAEDLLGASVNLGGFLGAVKGESAANVEARVEEAKKAAVDLTSLVRKKAKDTETKENTRDIPPAATNGKRKAEEENAAPESDSKKAKVEDAPEDSNAK